MPKYLQFVQSCLAAVRIHWKMLLQLQLRYYLSQCYPISLVFLPVCWWLLALLCVYCNRFYWCDRRTRRHRLRDQPSRSPSLIWSKYNHRRYSSLREQEWKQFCAICEEEERESGRTYSEQLGTIDDRSPDENQTWNLLPNDLQAFCHKFLPELVEPAKANGGDARRSIYPSCMICLLCLLLLPRKNKNPFLPKLVPDGLFYLLYYDKRIEWWNTNIILQAFLPFLCQGLYRKLESVWIKIMKIFFTLEMQNRQCRHSRFFSYSIFLGGIEWIY